MKGLTLIHFSKRSHCWRICMHPWTVPSQEMAGTEQAQSHYLNQCWRRVWTLRTNFHAIFIEMKSLPFKTVDLKMSSAKYRLLNVGHFVQTTVYWNVPNGFRDPVSTQRDLVYDPYKTYRSKHIGNCSAHDMCAIYGRTQCVYIYCKGSFNEN